MFTLAEQGVSFLRFQLHLLSFGEHAHVLLLMWLLRAAHTTANIIPETNQSLYDTKNFNY